MPTIQLDAENAVDQLLEIADALPDDKFDTLLSHLLVRSAERKHPHLSSEETQLFQIINRGLSLEEHQRYMELNSKLEDETMTTEEQPEFLALIHKIEKLDGDRLRALIELSKIRGTTLVDLMSSLGIKSPN